VLAFLLGDIHLSGTYFKIFYQNEKAVKLAKKLYTGNLNQVIMKSRYIGSGDSYFNHESLEA
jgi:hypothetical protein